MKDKYTFLMGLGTGLVLSSILVLFMYNVFDFSKDETNINENSTTQITTIQTTETTNTQNSTIEEMKTTQKLEINTQNIEITTEKPFELTTNKPFSLSEHSQDEQSFVEAD